MNGEGRTACDVAKNRDVQRLLEAAQKAERHERELALLNAAKDGRVEDINELVSMIKLSSSLKPLSHLNVFCQEIQNLV